MKKLMFIISFLIFIAFVAKSQNLIAEFKSTPYIKELDNGKKTIEFYIHGIQNEKEARNIENYIKAYRGVEKFTITKENSIYKAEGTFYKYANNLYFKNLFKLINISKIKYNNSFTYTDDFVFQID